MEVNFFAGLRQIVGQKTIDIPVPDGTTMRQLVREVIHRYPLLERELFNANGDLYGHVHVMINGRDIRYLDGGIDRVISPDDRVSMFPAIGGGCSIAVSGLRVHEIQDFAIRRITK